MTARTDPPRGSRLAARSTAAALAAFTAMGSGLLAAPAQAGWQYLDQRAVNVVLACRDGIRFEAGFAVFDGQLPGGDSQIRAQVKASQPAPQEGRPWNDAANVINAPITIARLPAPISVPRGNGTTETITLSHRGRYLLPVPAGRLPLSVAPLAIALGQVPSYATADVNDCYLYAPVDIDPGSRRNRVSIARGEVTVALKSTRYLRADTLEAKTFRLGPKSAQVRRSRIADVDRDGRRDLVLTFRAAATGLTCSSTSAALVGKNRAGGRVEGRDRVVPTGCRP